MSPATSTQRCAHRRPSPAAQRLLSKAETLEEVAAELPALVTGPESLARLEVSAAALESACRNLARATTKMALAAMDCRSGMHVESPGPESRATAWRLHHLSKRLRESAEVCRAVAGGAEAFELELAESDDAES